MNTCPGCSMKNEPHYKFCLGCGEELPSSPIIPAPTSSGWVDEPSRPGPRAEVAPALREAQAASTPASARSCAVCGAVVPATFTFCGQCGGRMDAAPTTLRDATSGGVTQGRLVLVHADGSEGAAHALSAGKNHIGRGKGRLFDSDGYLSPTHAVITLGDAGVAVSDAGSLNGIFVRLTAEEELFDGDVFRVGQELLRFQLLPPAEPLADGTHIMGSPPGRAWGRLVLIVARDQEGSAFPLAGEACVLGRERGDILFSEDGYVSGSHARVSTRGNRYFLTDLNSSNGTFIQLRTERALPSGALVLMGQQLFRVVY